MAIDTEIKVILYDRAKTIYDTMTRCEKGAEVHQIENIRHTVSMLMECIEEEDLDQKACEAILARLEKQVFDLFNKRYGPK